MLPQKYQKAWQFAIVQHFGQTMPDSQNPYIEHLGNVAFEVLLAAAKSPDLDIEFALTMAILHDTLEDTNCTYEMIESEFGKRIADGVLALTKFEDLPKEQQMQDSLQRIVLLENEVGAVKLADRITNLQPPRPSWNKEKIKKYHQEAQLILEKLGHCNAILAQRLANEIERYVRYF